MKIDLNSVPIDIITRERIIAKVTNLELIHYYIDNSIKVGISINSPLRKDKDPSFGLFYSSYVQDLILFKDFATGETGDTFELISRCLHLSVLQFYNKVNQDFNLKYANNKSDISSTSSSSYVKNTYKKISGPSSMRAKLALKKRNWKQLDKDYWFDKYGITSAQLKYYNVIPVLSVYYNDSVIWYHNDKDPIYAYLFCKDGIYSYKFYRPLHTSKKGKWMSNVDSSVLQGWDQLPKTGDLLILTKSLKDVIVYRNLGYNALSCQSETGTVKLPVMDELKERFTRIALQNDFDAAGVRGTNNMHKLYGFPYFFLQSFSTRDNGCKDISDYRELHDRETTIKFINEKLSKLWKK